MTEDEMNRKMEFLVEWQAQFAADMEILKERQAASDLKLDRLEDVAGTALDAATRTAEVLARFIEEQATAHEDVRRRFAETDRLITRVARIVEAHVREGHGSKDV